MTNIVMILMSSYLTKLYRKDIFQLQIHGLCYARDTDEISTEYKFSEKNNNTRSNNFYRVYCLTAVYA